MQPNTQVQIELESGTVTGLVLKSGRTGSKFLVTYELDGKVVTTWLLAEQIRVAGEPV